MVQDTTALKDRYTIPKLRLIVDANITMGDVEAALNSGDAHIHITTSYERMEQVGRVIKSLPRERVFVSAAWSGTGGSSAVEADLRTLLQELGLSYVDLYFLPSSVSDVWAVMEHVRDVRPARSIRFSGFDAVQLTELLASAKHPPEMNQLDFADWSSRRLRILGVCAAKNSIVATTCSLELLAPQVRTVVDVIDECEKVAPETVLLAWARAKGGVALVAQVLPSEDFTLSAVDGAAIGEAACRKQAAASFRQAGLDEAASPIDIASAPAVPMVDAPCHTAFVAGSDQSSMDVAPPPYSKAAPTPPPPTSARSLPFDCLGVATVELGYTLTPEELVAWLEYRSSVRTVQLAIWVYLVPVAMYRYYLRWRAR